jgi:hypothetical protein
VFVSDATAVLSNQDEPVRTGDDNSLKKIIKPPKIAFKAALKKMG